MRVKILIQLVLFIFFLITIFFFYFKYFSSDKNEVISTIPEENFKDFNQENNLIKDLDYLSTDKNGNKYLITSEYGEISSENSNIILMKNVKARIELFEKDTIYIKSLSAKYDTQNFETNFSQNVKLNYIDHEITSENLDLSFKESFVWVYTSVVYIDPYYKLFADKIEIDLLTKNSKIFMNNKKKVKIIRKTKWQ